MESEKEIKTGIISIRELSKYPDNVDLPILREGIIAAYDELLKCYDKKPDDNETFEESQKKLHDITMLTCGESSRTLLDFLNLYHKGEFDTYLISVSPDSSLKYFNTSGHSIAIIYSKKTKVWYACSPGNIFNLDMTIANFQGIDYTRSTDIFYSDNYSELIEMVSNFEGGKDIWPKDLKGFEYSQPSIEVNN